MNIVGLSVRKIDGSIKNDAESVRIHERDFRDIEIQVTV